MNFKIHVFRLQNANEYQVGHQYLAKFYKTILRSIHD
jgi:hypothetical protein